MNSSISEMPGPAVEVNDRAPAQPAPITIPAAASSSSAWIMAYFRSPVTGSLRYFSQNPLNASMSDVDGVIGYQAPTVAPAYTQPSAAAVFPSMTLEPAVAFMRSRCMGSGHLKVLSAYSWPS